MAHEDENMGFSSLETPFFSSEASSLHGAGGSSSQPSHPRGVWRSLLGFVSGFGQDSVPGNFGDGSG